MKIWVFDDNLLWTTRLVRGLAALGHRAEPLLDIPIGEPRADAALLNLSSKRVKEAMLIPRLRAMEILTIGFAGHKEKQLLEEGAALGCDVLATNSEVALNLEHLMARVLTATR
jgi:hypothetical protein